MKAKKGRGGVDIRGHTQLSYSYATTPGMPEAAVALSTEHSIFPVWTASGNVQRGWALAEQGHTTEGTELIQQGISVLQNLNVNAITQTYCIALLAESYARAEQLNESLRLLDEALAARDSMKLSYTV